ncbi:MAG: cohesin domain-containing protein [Oscillospiraceae bacterium]|nr:cohesin domain-containing protein [Oscillospiraceae bacterium]
MRKRAIRPCALTLVLLLGVFGGVDLAALAAGEVMVRVKDVSVSAGQTVTTELIMEGTFAAFQGVLTYDTGALTLEKIEATSLLSESMTMFTQDEITGAFTNGSFVSASAHNAEISGAVLTFTFRAGDNADGTYSFRVEQLLVCDEEGVPLTVNAADTIVVPVTPPSPTPTPAPATREPTPAPTAQTPTPAPTTQTPTPAPTTRAPTPAPAADGPAPNPSDGSGRVILPWVIAAAAVVGALLIAVRIRKKEKSNKRKE